MNLREIHLSSRSVIPVALALPINRGPVDPRHEERERRRLEAQRDEAQRPDTSVSFYI